MKNLIPMHAGPRWFSLTASMCCAVLLVGCASNLTGYKAETESTCRVSEGVPCTPVSDIYKKAMAGALPGQQKPRHDAPQDSAAGQGAPYLPSAGNLATQALRPSMSSGMPVRTAPRVMRIWYAPWKDELDVLHDQRHSYLTLDQGRWLIEHNQNQLVRTFSTNTRLYQGQANAAPSTPPQTRNPAAANNNQTPTGKLLSNIPGAQQ